VHSTHGCLPRKSHALVDVDPKEDVVPSMDSNPGPNQLVQYEPVRPQRGFQFWSQQSAERLQPNQPNHRSTDSTVHGIHSLEASISYGDSDGCEDKAQGLGGNVNTDVVAGEPL
jgi:hypothetical protein